MNSVMLTDKYLKVFTGLLPFHNLPREATVILQVMDNKRPDRPSHSARQLGLNDQIWQMMESGWAPYPHDRPNIQCFSELVSIVQYAIGSN
jgi:hypothetical protein